MTALQQQMALFDETPAPLAESQPPPRRRAVVLETSVALNCQCRDRAIFLLGNSGYCHKCLTKTLRARKLLKDERYQEALKTYTEEVAPEEPPAEAPEGEAEEAPEPPAETPKAQEESFQAAFAAAVDLLRTRGVPAASRPRNPCYVATAPGDPDTVYLANWSGVSPSGFCISQLMESTSGGAAGSWVDMDVTASNCRDAWVVTHPDLGGDPDRFEVYFGSSKHVLHQNCDLTATPRCQTGAANWPDADSGAHSDPSDLAFDPDSAHTTGKAIVMVQNGIHSGEIDGSRSRDDHC